MPEQPLQTLDLQSRHLEMLRGLLQQHLPHAEVWAYGSRVNGNGHDASDLDLVARQPNDLTRQTREVGEVREAFVESNLPIRVEIADWARIPASFQREIERAYVVVQTARATPESPLKNPG
jgi:predicted nucleotidyltransferase